MVMVLNGKDCNALLFSLRSIDCFDLSRIPLNGSLLFCIGNGIFESSVSPPCALSLCGDSS